MSELLRANKVTTRFEGDGVAVATFYKTHDKLGEIKSNDLRVAGLKFVMPESTPASEGVDPVEVTPSQKLNAFKEFAQVNATAFGFVYDPIDRRLDGNRFPSTYNGETLLTTATAVLTERLGELVTSVQKNVDSLVKQGAIAEGATLSCTMGVGSVEIGEAYKNGNLKYADVKVPVTFTVCDKSATLEIPVQLVSGQLKKPKALGESYVLTATGLKTALIDNGVIPKVEKKEDKAEDAASEVAPTTEGQGQAQ